MRYIKERQLRNYESNRKVLDAVKEQLIEGKIDYEEAVNKLYVKHWSWDRAREIVSGWELPVVT